MTTIENVQKFLDSIDFSQYADIKKINIKGDVVTITLTNTYRNPANAHEDFSKKFGFEAVKVTVGSTAQYLMNVPEKGSFGFIQTYSRDTDSYEFMFVIYNQTYAVKAPEQASLASLFINKVESVIAPHVQSIREIFTIDKESLINETLNEKQVKDSHVEKAFRPFVNALKEKFLEAREKKVDPKEETSGVTFEKDSQGKVVIKQNGKTVGNQG